MAGRVMPHIDRSLQTIPGVEVIQGLGSRVAPDIVGCLQAGIHLVGANRQVFKEPGVVHDARDADPLPRLWAQQLPQQIPTRN